LISYQGVIDLELYSLDYFLGINVPDATHLGHPGENEIYKALSTNIPSVKIETIFFGFAGITTISIADRN